MTDPEKAEVSSILSGKQRRWLRGDDEALSSPDRVIRSRIRQRFKQSISDLALLYESDRISSEDLMKSVRESHTSNSDVNDAVASGGKIDEDMILDTLSASFSHLETVSGTNMSEFGMEDVVDYLQQAVPKNATLDEESYPLIAVLGAYTALQTTDKTEKQARQWIEHHWPDSDEALDFTEEATKLIETTGLY